MIAMRILTGKNPEIIDIRNRLHELQLAVEGYIEVIPCPWDRMARLVVNEEGKIRHMPPNRILNDPHTGMYAEGAGTGQYRYAGTSASDPLHKAGGSPGESVKKI